MWDIAFVLKPFREGDTEQKKFESWKGRSAANWSVAKAAEVVEVNGPLMG